MSSASTFFAPLSFAQERLLFFDRLSPGSALYAVPYRLDFTGDIDARALDRALVGLAQRHEVLRTCFVEHEGEYCQQVLPDTNLRLQIDDLSQQSDAAQAVETIAREFGCAPYDLQRGPLIRARLLRLSGQRHVLLLGLHHIIFDGPSAAVVARELNELYMAACEGRSAHLPDLPIQYADFAQWQRQRYASGELEPDLTYWKAALEGVPVLLELPTDRPRPAARNYCGQTLPVVLPRQMKEGLQILSQQLDVTPFVTFCTLVHVLLARYSGQSDVCLGFPVAGRAHPDLEGLIGFFSNTLVLRPRLPTDCTFREAAARTQECVLAALEHGELPFDKLVEALAPTRSLGWHPLFQACVVYQSGEEAGWRLGEASARFIPTDVGISKFDITFYLDEGPEHSTLRIEYSTELFDAATIDRLQRNLQHLCAAICASPDEPLSVIELASAAERQQVLDAGRGRKPTLPRAGLATLFEEQVWRTPSQVAVQGADIELNYIQLDARAERVAKRLCQAGIGAEDRVAIVCARGPQMVVGVLGVLKVEAAYVPLDPAYPAERLRFMVADSGAALVLGDTQSLAALADWGLPAIDIEAAVVDGGIDAVVLPPRLDRNDLLAYIMYTSGSTGRPKGVGVEHRSIMRLVLGADFVPFTDRLTLAQLSSFSFDASTFEFWGALLHGGTLVLFEDLTRLQPDLFREYLTRNRITSVFVTTALLNRLIEARPDTFAGVRHLLYGGERVDMTTAKKLRDHGLIGQVIHCYGPTETTTFVCTHVTRDADIDAGDIPIGAPIAHTDMYILGPRYEASPIGVAGELYISGVGVARGYLGRPALTAERFVPDPFSEVQGARMYRTGDRCMWNADGTLRYVCRIDDQVKIDGFRIELEEVRLTMLGAPGVAQAAVHMQLTEDGQKRLVGYVIGEPGLTGADVKKFLSVSLPRYMIPAHIHPVPAFPLTANGKTDFKALEQQCRSSPDVAIAPRQQSDLTAAFFSMVAEIVGAAEASPDDRFFDIGGSSLTAMRLIARVESDLERRLPLATIFQADRLGDIAATIESLPRRPAGGPQRSSQEQAGLAPLSFAQQRLYFFDRLSPGTALYAVPYRFELNAEIDAEALERALIALIDRHEVLRTCFVEHEGGFFQHVLPEIGFRLGFEDLSRESRVDAVDAMARELGAAPYDLQHGPLIRARLLRLGDRRYVLLLGLHHIIFDAASSSIMARELNELYVAAHEGHVARLPELRVQYGDFARWQRQRHAEGQLEKDLAYWKATLAGAPTLLDLPTDRPRPAVRGYSGQSICKVAPTSLHDGLLSLARSLSVTPFAAFSAVLSVLLIRYSGQDDICLGFPVAGRGHPDLEGLIGFFSNTLVLRPRLPRGCTYRQAIERTQQCVLAALEHAEMPFDELVDVLAPERSLGWHPLFQVCVVYQTGESHWRLGDARATYVPTDVDISKFDITFTLEQRSDGTSFLVEFSDEIFYRGTVNAMLDALLASLQVCIDNPGASTWQTGACALSAVPEKRLRKRC